jgi:hypothetical protein
VAADISALPSGGALVVGGVVVAVAADAGLDDPDVVGAPVVAATLAAPGRRDGPTDVMPERGASRGVQQGARP